MPPSGAGVRHGWDARNAGLAAAAKLPVLPVCPLSTRVGPPLLVLPEGPQPGPKAFFLEEAIAATLGFGSGRHTLLLIRMVPVDVQCGPDWSEPTALISPASQVRKAATAWVGHT